MNGATTDGSLSITVDADSDTFETLTMNGQVSNVAVLTLSGGLTGGPPVPDDLIDVNADLTTTAGALTIQTAALVTIDAAVARTLTSNRGDLSIVTNVTQITLDGGADLVTLDANGLEGAGDDSDVLLGPVNTINPVTAPSLTVTADGSATFSTIDLNGTTTDGVLSIAVDVNDGGTETLTINGGITNAASMTLSGGGTGTNDTIDVNANLTTSAGALTIQNAARVTIDAAAPRTLTSNGGDLNIVSNVAQITLDGGANTVTLDANGAGAVGDADVTLTAVNTGAAPPVAAASLTVTADGGATFSTIDLNGTTTDGALAITVDADGDTFETLTMNGQVSNVALLTLSGGLTGLPLVPDDTIDVNANLTTTAGALTIQNAASVTIDAAAPRTLTSNAGDIRIVTSVTQITLDGGANTVTLDANGAGAVGDADVTLAAVNTGAAAPVAAASLTVTADGGATFSTIDLNGSTTDGVLSITVDADADTFETLTMNGQVSNVAVLTLSGGLTGGPPVPDDLIDVNADLTTTAGALTIQTAALVTIDASVARTLTSNGGDIRIVTDVTEISMNNGSDLVTLDANGEEAAGNEADVVLAPVTDTNNPSLTVNSEGSVDLASVNMGTGTLAVHIDNGGVAGAETGVFGALTAGTVAVDGTSSNDTLTFNGTVTSTVAGVTIQTASQIDLQNVTAQTALAVTGTNIDLNNTAYTSNTDDVTFTGAVDLDAAPGTITVTGGGDADDSVVFTGVVNDTGYDNTLVVLAGAGPVTFSTSVGATNALGALSVTTSGQISLGGNISTDTSAGTGAVSFSGGGIVVLMISLTIDTQQSGLAAGGAVNLGTSPVTGDATAGRDLTINTSTAFATGAGGAVTLFTFVDADAGAAVNTFVNDLAIDTRPGAGGSAGQLTLAGATIYLDDDGLGDLPSFAFNNFAGASGNTLLTTNVTIDTEQGDNANGGNVTFPLLGTMTRDATARELTIDVRRNSFTDHAANDGNIQLPGQIGVTGGVLGRVTVLADGGIITVGNDGAATPAATIRTSQTTAPHAIQFGSSTVLTGNTTVTTSGGAADYSDTIFSSNASGPWTLTINTTDGGAGNDGDIYLAGANNVAGGRYLSTVTLTATDGGGTAGNLTFVNDAAATVDFRTADANLTFVGGDVIVSDTTLIDTDQVNGTPSGAVNLDSSKIYASTTGLSLTLNTATTGGVAGAVTLGPVGNGGGGAGKAYLQSLVINADGVTDGIVTPNGDISVDSGPVTIDGDIRLPASRTIDTEQDGVGPGGAVNLAVTSGSVSATPAAVSFNLTIDTTTAAAGQSGGPVTLGVFNNSGGSYVTDLTITTSGTSGDVAFTRAAATVGKIKVNSGHDITVAVGGSVNSGGNGTVAGADIGMYALSGTILVNGPISSTIGAGGTVDINGGVIVNVNVTSGAGPITLNGNLDPDTDLDINSPAIIHGAGTVRLSAPRNVFIGGTVEAAVGADIQVTADTASASGPADGAGGVRVEPTGLIDSGRDVSITGSDLTTTGPGIVDYVLIDADNIDPLNDQVRAVRDITMAPQAATPAGSDAVLNGRVGATGAGGAISISAPNDVRGAATGDLFTNNGPITISADSGAGGASNNDGTIQLAGDITAAGGVVTFSLADCDGWIGATPGSPDGNIEPTAAPGTSVVKAGSGILRLNGAANRYTGTTTVNNGTLLVNGEILGAGGTVTVTPLPAGSTPVLGGNGYGDYFGAPNNSTGTINRTVSIASGGILDPGDCTSGGLSFTPSCTSQAGKLTVTGDVALVAGAIFRVQLNGVKPGRETPPPPDGFSRGYDQLTVNGGVTLGGSTLQTSVGFTMPVGATYRIIDNNLSDPINNQFNGLAEGDFFHSGSYVMNISYQSGSNSNDVTLIHPGRYDFDANPADTQPWYESMGPAPFYGPLYPASSPGWDATVLEAGRGGSEGTGLPRDPNTPVRLLEDLAVTGSQATFLVDALAKDTMDPSGASLQYQVLITSGDYGYAHNGSRFQVGDSDHPSQQTVTASTNGSEFAQLVVRPITIDELVHDSYIGQLRVLMSYVGGLSGWTAVINGVDIRPIASVGNILLTNVATPPAGSTQPPFNPLTADGLTIDSYYGWGATPNSLITVSSLLKVTSPTGVVTGTPLGTVLPLTPTGAGTTDQDRYLQGVQVLSDASGNFRFQVQRPSGTGAAGTGTATIETWDIGGRSYGTVGQSYNQDYTAAGADPIGWRRFDFNSSSSPTATGFLGVLPDVPYTDTNGYGWATPVGAVDRLQSTDWLRRDFHWAQSATFQVQGIPGQTYSLRALFGEPTDGVLYDSGSNAGQLGATGASFGEGSVSDASSQNPTTITITVNGTATTLTKPWQNQFLDSATFSGTADVNGVISIAFSAGGGLDPYFAIDGLAIWQAGLGPPVGSPQLLAVDTSTGGGTGSVVTQASLGLMIAEARARWETFGLTAAQSATLRALNYGVADLPDQQLASTDANGTSIVVDQNADGRGWFIDPTPWEDSEYVLGQTPPGVDLLTVVMHEMGHALGYTDVDTSQYPEALMALQLMPEQARRVPTGPLVTGTNPIQAIDVNGDGNVTPTDVLQLVNRINMSGGALSPVESGSSPAFYDVSGDNTLSALDVLWVVNYLNTPRLAQQIAPAPAASGSPAPLIAAAPSVSPVPVGASITIADVATPATDQVAAPAAEAETPMLVAPVAEGEAWLDDLAADVHAALPAALAADALFQELGNS